jgi:hypothetical protein
VAGNELKIWSIAYYAMDQDQLLAEIVRLEAIQGSLDQQMRAQVLIGQCRTLLEEQYGHLGDRSGEAWPTNGRCIR